MTPNKLSPEQLEQIISEIVANHSRIPEILSKISNAGLKKMLSECEVVLSQKSEELRTFELVDFASTAEEIKKILASRELDTAAQ